MPPLECINFEFDPAPTRTLDVEKIVIRRAWVAAGAELEGDEKKNTAAQGVTLLTTKDERSMPKSTCAMSR